jgi:hypothetical protein
MLVTDDVPVPLGSALNFAVLRNQDVYPGTRMFIPDPGSDFFPSRIRIVPIPDPHQ